MQDGKKSIPVTMRMTQSQLDELKRLAAERSQSVSQYGVEHIFQSGGITDTKLRQVFFSLANIKDIVKFQTDCTPAVRSSVLKECDAIWQSLKS